MKIGFRISWLLLAAAMVGALLIASCSGTTSSPDKSVTLADTKPYGSVTVWGTFITGSIDPAQNGSYGSYRGLGAMFFESLIELDNNGQPRPGIAERWEIAPDGMSLTFYIRKGVKFHDGSDLTGADVKFSLDRIMASDATHTTSANMRNDIANVVLKDDYTVAVNFKTRQFDLMWGSYDMPGNQAVLPKKYIEERGVDYFRAHPIGSGPWKVTKLELGSRVELEAVDNHWRETPKFQNLTFLYVPEESTKIAMLKTGELDIAPVLPDSVASVKAAGLQILKNEAGGQGFIFPFYDVDNSQKYALGDVNVRKALSLGMNRQEMANNLYGGYAAPSVATFMPQTAFFFDPNVLKADPYDPEGAKKLLTEAGYANGFDTKVFETGASDYRLMQQAVAGYWRKIGVRADLTAIEFATLRTMYFPKQKPEVFNSLMVYVTGSAGMQFENMAIGYHSVKGSGKTIKDPALDALIDKVPTITDPAEKKKVGLEAAVKAKNSYAIIPVLDLQTLFAFDSKVGEIRLTKGVPELGLNYASMTHAK